VNRPRRTEIQILTISMLDVISAALAAVLILFIVTLKRAEEMQAQMVPVAELQLAEQRLAEAEAATDLQRALVVSAEDRARMAENAASRSAQEAERALARADRAEIDAASARASQQDIALRIRLAMEAQRASEAATRRAEENARAAEAHAAEAEALAAQAVLAADGLRAELDAANRHLVGAVSCQVETAAVRLSFFDNDRPDGDRVNVFLNGDMIVEDLRLPAPNRAHRVDITLQPGLNHLRIVATDPGADGNVNTAEVEIAPCNNDRADNFDWDLVEGADRNLVLLYRE
jgi:hypothetical protein